jgi:hypothetical protein
MKRQPLAWLLAAALLCPTAGLGQDAAQPAPAQPRPEPSETAPDDAFAFGRANPDCREWTNTCQACVRDDKGAAQCSTPGIACQPSPSVCLVPGAK